MRIMCEQFYIIKVVDTATSIISELEKKKGIYYVRADASTDKLVVQEIPENFEVVFVQFTKEDDQYTPIKAYLGKGVHLLNENKIHFTIQKVTCSWLVIENFCRSISFDLKGSYQEKSYVFMETAKELLDDFKVNVYENNNVLEEKTDFDNFIFDNGSQFAQDDMYAMRMYKVTMSKGDTRTQYERDRDRIIHSKSSRRLVDKAQIFTSSKGDHYRTRMTHTLEVTQIARSISRQLGLNEALSEAIALAHDLGHTPFGHQGERTLDHILKGKFGIIPDISSDIADLEQFNAIHPQGFKHNYQALRVLTLLEHKYVTLPGLNISYQVMEGVWKHTRIHSKQSGKLMFPMEDFFQYEQSDMLYPEYAFSTTLEGQVVAIADEIAQRSHDLDDALKSYKITIAELKKYTSIRNAGGISSMIENIDQEIAALKQQNYVFVDEQDMFRARLCSSIIDFFIRDVVTATKENMEQYEGDVNFTNYHIFSEKLVYFSEIGHQLSSLLENVVTNKVINSREVSQFDTTASKVIQKLFAYYYENPLTMNHSTLIHMYLEFKKVSTNVIDLRSSDIALLADEMYKITQADLKSFADDEERREYARKREILVRNIADDISGMTDSYALNEYHKVYAL